MDQDKKNILISYLILYVLWSTTYIAMKTGIKHIPLFMFLGARWLFSGIFVIFLVFMFRGSIKATWKQILSASILGVFLILGSNSLLTYALKTVDSYLAAVIMATVPLIMTLTDRVVCGIRINAKTVVGIFLGLVGIYILLYKGDLIIDFDPGVILIFMSMAIWAFGSSLSKKIDLPENSMLNSGIQMLASGLVATVIFSLQDIQLPEFDVMSFSALVYLIFAGAIGMIAYLYLIRKEPLSKVSTYAYVNPVGAAILGVIFGEMLSLNFFIAFPIIMLALYLILRSRN
jgi:drug/metabolite transporter (DMT)-like permease